MTEEASSEESCYFCDRLLVATGEEVWTTEDGVKVSVAISESILLLTIDDSEHHICEPCYVANRCESLPEVLQYEAHYQVALHYCRHDEYEKAQQAVLRSLALQRTADALATLGYIEVGLGQLEVARRTYREALQLEPNHFAARENLAMLEEEFRS